jgi:ubiquitin C-terminal hydrolase
MYRSPFGYGQSGSSSIRAASQLKPVKPTYSSALRTPVTNIYQSSTLGGSSSKFGLPYYLQSPSDPDKPKGLVNLRNTCYINSVLQLLFEVLDLPVTAYSKPLTKAFMNLKASGSVTDYKDFKK